MASNRTAAGKSTRKRFLRLLNIQLDDLRRLIEPDEFASRFEPGGDWKRYFQSPVDKAAWSEVKSFRFNHEGALEAISRTKRKLIEWLELPNSTEKRKGASAEKDIVKSISDWLKTGRVLSTPAVKRIAHWLDRETLEDPALYNQPICRLVRYDQLRYDVDYQAIYQLTPGQSRLMQPREAQFNLADWEQINRIRRTYWDVSEVFQSMVAMFDSEMGKAGNPQRTDETKEFIRIHVQDEHNFNKQPKSGSGNRDIGKDRKRHLTPNELNFFSPLRYWAPPSVFARSVFHMLFWKSIITNSDLYGRPVLLHNDGPVDRLIGARARSYYVIVNWFSAAKFRIAAYDEIFEGLHAIARRIFESAGGDLKKPVRDLKDLSLTGTDIKKLLLSKEFRASNSSRSSGVPSGLFMESRSRRVLSLAFGSASSDIFELARRYQGTRRNEPTRVEDILKFLRDSALETIIWSRFQMEIRSIGMIPVQHLYRLSLTPEGKRRVANLTRYYDEAAAKPKLARARFRSINDLLSKAIFSGEADGWVGLEKVYGGSHRDLLLREIIESADDPARPGVTPAESPAGSNKKAQSGALAFTGQGKIKRLETSKRKSVTKGAGRTHLT